MAKKIRMNKFNVEWLYAKQCWDALVKEEPIPPIPNYTIWESDDGATFVKEKISGYKPIDPMKVTCRGVTVYDPDAS